MVHYQTSSVILEHHRPNTRTLSAMFGHKAVVTDVELEKVFAAGLQETARSVKRVADDPAGGR